MKKIMMYLNLFTCLFSRIIPKKKNKWVFGAWFGNRISDNSYALYNYIQNEYPSIDTVWICNDVETAEKCNIKSVKRNSWKGIWTCLTARVVVMNQGYMDLGNLNWIAGSYKVQLWHGVPWKRIGEDMENHKKGLLHNFSHNVYKYVNKYDLYIAPSEDIYIIMQSAFLADKSKILKVGQPRNEMLMDQEKCIKARENVAEIVGNHNIMILYMPTFRDNSNSKFSFYSIKDDIIEILDRYDAVILEKQHYVDSVRMGAHETSSSRIFNVESVDSQELLASADILITDYSSCFFDYTLRKKPIIHYIYDYEYYKNKDRGLYFEKDYVMAGESAFTDLELIKAIENAIQDPEITLDRSELIRNRFCTFESHDNSRIICERILKDIKM